MQPAKPQQNQTAAGFRRAVALGLSLAATACSGTQPGELTRVMTSEARFVAASLFAPVGPETRPLGAALAPARKPAAPLTRSVTARDPRSGEQVRLEPRSLGRGVVEIRQNDGCTWRTGDWFAPSTAWRDCGDSRHWHTGQSTVSGGTGLWPLRAGAETRFTRRATSHTGRTYERETLCRVTDTVAVLRAGRAPTPAFVVDCTDGKRVRTTWWAPDEGPIAFRKIHDETGIEELWVAD